MTLRATWLPNPANENIIRYKLYERDGNKFHLLQATRNTSVTIGNVTGSHLYAVSAVNSAGEGPKSALVGQ